MVKLSVDTVPTFMSWLLVLGKAPGPLPSPPPNVNNVAAWLKQLENNRWIEHYGDGWRITPSAHSFLKNNSPSFKD